MSHSWSRARANRLWLLQAPMTRARRPLEIYPYFHRHLALDSSFDCRVCSCLPIILLTQKKELFNTKTEPICMQFAEWIISVSEIVGWIRCPGSIVVRRRLVTWESTFFQRSRLANGPTFWKLGLRRYDFDAAHDEREGWTRGYCFFFKDYQTKTPWNDLKRRCPRILAACFLSFSPRAAVPSLQSQPGKLKWVPAMSWWWLLPVAYVVVRLEIPSWCMPCMARCLLCPWRRDDPSWELMEELGQGDNGGGEQHSRWSSVCRGRSGRFWKTKHRSTCLWFMEKWPLSCRRSSASSSYVKDHDEPRMNPPETICCSTKSVLNSQMLHWRASSEGFLMRCWGRPARMQILGLQKLLWTLGNQWLKSIDLATVWRPREAFHRPSKVGIAQEKINDRWNRVVMGMQHKYFSFACLAANPRPPKWVFAIVNSCLISNLEAF